MSRISLSVFLGLSLMISTDCIGAEPLNFDIKNGVAPISLNRSGKTFSSPSGISTTPDGAYLLIADPGSNQIRVLDTGKLKQLSQFGKQNLSGPEDVAFADNGDLLVADTRNNRIMTYRFEGVYRDGDPNIKHLSTLSEGISGPKGVDGGPGDRLYVANSGGNSILLIREGEIVKQVTSAGPSNIPLSEPFDVHSDSRNRVLVSDTGNGRILVFDQDLNFTRELSGRQFGFKQPGRIASDDNGLILIADEGDNMIKIVGPEFKPRGRIAGSSTLASRLRGPQGVETIGRYMWVTDTGNRRVILYKRE